MRQTQLAGLGMRNDLIHKYRKFIERKASRRFVEGTRTLPNSGYAIGFAESDPQLTKGLSRLPRVQNSVRLHRSGYWLWN